MKFDYQPTSDDIRNLREWLNRIPYLPHDLEDHELSSFFRSCKGSLERTKNLIDKFYEGRIKYPEILKDFNPLSEAAQMDMDICMKLPLPKKTDDGCVVIVAKIKNLPSSKFVPSEIFRMYALIFRTLVMDDELGSGRVVFITDCEHLKLAHIKKITPGLVVTVISLIASAFPCRIAAMHAVSLPQAAEWIVNLGKNILKTKIAQRIHVHSNPEDLLNYYSKEILPSDFGGNEQSLQKLHDGYRKKLESYTPKFMEEEIKLRKLEALRPKSDENMMVGSFRNLQVD